MRDFRRLITLFFVLGITLNAFSQGFVFGKVQDAFLKTPLPEANVSLLLAADSTVIIDSIPVKKKYWEDGTVKEAEFSIKMERKTCNYLLRARLDGYEDGYLPLSIDGNDDRFWIMDNPLELRRLRQMKLDEVMVTATKVKMYWKGDTIVYDAYAFKLPDGSMLDELIHQMPGVTINESGEIFVHNRKIDELQLCSRSFMRGNSKVLMENLPYYTVKDVKVYEQNTDLNRAIDAQIEKKKFVMDVNLKPEYQVGYVANVEAAGGTQERWLGRAFLLGFTNRTRYTFFANSNNVNESRHIGRSGYWTPNSVPRSLLTTHSTAGEIDYQSADKNVKENLNVDFTSTRNEGEMIQSRELFLTGNPWQNTHHVSLAKSNRLKANNAFSYVKPKGLMFETTFNFNYNSYSGNSFMLTDQFVDTLVNRQHSDGFNDGKSWTTNFYARIQPMFKKIGIFDQLFRFTTHFDYTSEDNQKAQHFRVDDYINHSSNVSYNTNDYSNKKTALRLPISYMLINERGYMSIEAVPLFSREKTHDWLYHPDSLMLPSQIDMLQSITDRKNSYNSELETYSNDININFALHQKLPPTKALPISGYHNFLMFYLTITPTHEKLHYMRGATYTLATRNSIRFTPRLEIKLFAKKDPLLPIFIRILHTEYNAPLINQIDFRDDATPLVVRLGNPDLKPWNSGTSVSADFNNRTSRRYNYNFSVNYSYNHQVVAQSVRFNPITSVYTYRPENVSGSYGAGIKANIFYTLDARGYWTVGNNFDEDFDHWLDYVMLDGETESRLSAVDIWNLHDHAYIQYNKNAFNIRATGDVTWRHSKSNIQTLNVTDYKYGLSARYTIPRLKTTVSADGNMYSRRGYGSAELNTDDFVLNASVSQPFLKGKLIARVEAFDLLHQLSSTQYAVNPQGRTETWYRSLPNYVMFHLVYHWNRNPKKQK